MTQISIIIPVFNTDLSLLERAILSCTRQTLEDIEILVIYDGLQNENLLTVHGLDKRVKIIRNPSNLGTFASRNIGVINANSSLIMFLDADDFLDLKACEKALDLMQKGFDMVCFDAFVHRVKTKKFYKFKDEFFNQREFLDFLLRQKHFCWSVWAKVFKRDLILKAFEFINPKERLSYGEDFLFCYMNFMVCENFMTSRECIYHYEFNFSGRYESKNREILRQNYEDKRKSMRLIKELSKHLRREEFNENLFKILQKELEGLRLRLERI